MPMCHAGGLDVNIITSCAAGAHNCLTPLRSRLVNISYSNHSAYIFTHCTPYTYGIIYGKARLNQTILVALLSIFVTDKNFYYCSHIYVSANSLPHTIYGNTGTTTALGPLQ